MRFRKCDECDRYAMTHLTIEGAVRQLCLDCLKGAGEGAPPPTHVCSVAECENAPDYMAVVWEDGLRSVLVCETHFRKLRPVIRAFLTVPRWLTHGSFVGLDDEGVTFDLDLTDDDD